MLFVKFYELEFLSLQKIRFNHIVLLNPEVKNPVAEPRGIS